MINTPDDDDIFGNDDIFDEDSLGDNSPRPPAPSTNPAPISTGRSYYNQGSALMILKMSHSRFKKLGLLPIRKGYNINGGKIYWYDRRQIDELANNPDAIQRLINADKNRIRDEWDELAEELI